MIPPSCPVLPGSRPPKRYVQVRSQLTHQWRLVWIALMTWEWASWTRGNDFRSFFCGCCIRPIDSIDTREKESFQKDWIWRTLRWILPARPAEPIDYIPTLQSIRDLGDRTNVRKLRRDKECRPDSRRCNPERRDKMRYSQNLRKWWSGFRKLLGKVVWFKILICL